jgi:hypothetical protein
MVVKSGTGASYGAGSTNSGSDTGITGDRTIGTQVAIAAIETRNSGNSVITGATVAASISGPGLVLVDGTDGSAVGTARSSSSVRTAASTAYVHVSGDGTSGVGTVTINILLVGE